MIHPASHRLRLSVATLFLAASLAFAQAPQPKPTAPSQPSDPAAQQATHDMSHMDMGSHPAAGQAKADLEQTTSSMSKPHDHMEMGAHMKMSPLRPTAPGDAARAQQVVETARQVLTPYRDYQRALDDGYKIFLPNVPQKMYHFTNWKYAIEAAFTFNPAHPTSLLYDKTPEGYKLIGAMYTAPARMDESGLDKRIPLSQAQWHLHVNLCQPPKDRQMEQLGKNPRFGLAGSIATKQECDQAGGKFSDHIFGWMVHLYPFESTPDKIWSVERQQQGMHDHHHTD